MAPIIKSDSGSVDSSSIISALGFTPFNETGDTLTGTGGAGFYGAIPQSSAPSTPASGFRLYANSAGLLEWKGTNGFTRTFDGSANTADRAYTLPNSSGTIALEGTLTSLANPTIQNTYYQFVQTTAPTQRAVGVPLVAGDRWYKPDERTEWSWSGTYWLCEQYSSVFTQFTSPGTKAYGNNQYNLFTTASTALQYASNYVLVEAVELYLTNISTSFFTGVLDASNRFNIGIGGVATGKVTVSSLSFFNNRNGLPRQLISTPLVIPSQKTGEIMASLLTIDGVVGSPSISWSSGFNSYIITKSRRIFE